MMSELSSMVRERMVATNGVQLRVLESGERGAPLVVLAHGCPELAFSWRHQLPALARAGFHVLAPDQRGYGQSTRPKAVRDYDIIELTKDLLGLLDAIGADRAAFVGDDWGAIVAWSQALLNPRRVAAVVGINVPMQPRAQVPPLSTLAKMFAGKFSPWLYFQEPGIADANMGRDVAATMRRLLAHPTSASLDTRPGPQGFVDRFPEPEQLPAWLSSDELDYYIAEFSRTGFTGGLNWYRNIDRNWELTEGLANSKVTVPSLFIGGAQDPTLSWLPPAAATPLLTRHHGDIIIDGAGHWVQQQQPQSVNAALIEFLRTARL